MKALYFLNPDIVFLNHGSFGATPRAVMAAFQAWQVRLEQQPVQFFARELISELEQARQNLGSFLNADAGDLVFIPNATVGVNIIARSLPFEPGDEILTTDHEYGACQNVWNYFSQKNGIVIVKQPIPLPLASPDNIVEHFWLGVTPRTRVIFISHITSPTAVRLPVERICKRARAAGILTIIDGAHAPGQISLDLSSVDPDFYVGNCHKWLQSPKGAGLLYTRRALQTLLEPLLISWGWSEHPMFASRSVKRLLNSKYLDYFEWTGTSDPSAYLTVPAAIDFQDQHHWAKVRQQCQQILAAGLDRINALTGFESVYPAGSPSFVQMAVVRLPRLRDPADFQRQLYEQYRIEVPCIEWNGELFLRISVQAYNTMTDVDALVAALGALLPLHQA